MLSPRAIVPLALYLGGAHAYIDLSGSAPAKPTLASMKALGVSVPEPTSPPKPSGLVEKRAQGANTCGYVEGESGNAVTCEADGSECLYESDASAVGCCATTNCDIWTACIDSTDSDIWSTADAERTRYCSESSAPYCAVYGYLDDVWDGYTMILCDSTPTTYDFYYTPEGADEDDATSFVLDNTASESGSKTTGGKGSEETGDAGNNSDDDDDDGGAPVGAIVGGTIGGVAALGLVGLAAFLLLRRRKSKDTPPAQPPMAAGQYQNQPPMAGGQYPNQPPPGVAGDPNQMYSGVPSMYMPPPGAPGGPPPGQPGLAPPGVAGGYYGPQHDQSMAKAPLSPMSTSPSQFTPTDPSQYNSSVAAGTPGAPPQSTSPPAGAAHTPPPPVYAAAYAQPGQQQQQQQQQTQNGAVELPTGRPDGELRELA